MEYFAVRIRGDHINRPYIWSTKFPERRGSILIRNGGAHLDVVAATHHPRDVLYYYSDVALLLKFVLQRCASFVVQSRRYV